jgi:hypothetical protein
MKVSLRKIYWNKKSYSKHGKRDCGKGDASSGRRLHYISNAVVLGPFFPAHFGFLQSESFS